MKNLLLICSLILLAACSHEPKDISLGKDTAESKPKETLVYIHGMHLDGTSWEQVATELSEQNYLLINLLGRSDKENASLTEMAEDVCKKIPYESALIAHSFGGAVANQMVGLCPKKIRKIIYVTALVPIKGERAFEAMKADQKDYKKVVKFGLRRMTPKNNKDFFQAMDPMVEMNIATDLKIFSESNTLGLDKIRYDEVDFIRISKSYIYTTQDKIIPLTAQEKYTGRTNMAKTQRIDSGHLPMLSKPKELANLIREML